MNVKTKKWFYFSVKIASAKTFIKKIYMHLQYSNEKLIINTYLFNFDHERRAECCVDLLGEVGHGKEIISLLDLQLINRDLLQSETLVGGRLKWRNCY